MDDLSQGFIDRVRMASAAGSGKLPEMARWLERNTANPLNTDENWTFDEHEYQIGIIESPARRKAIQKCSQVGLTEIALRIGLAVTAMMNDIRVVYTGPTSNFIAKLVKDRANTVINHSKVLSSLIDPDVNTNEQKKIGRSFIYFSGAFKPSNAISVPATFVISDEVDFSNPTVLSAFNSRLRHAKDGGYNWKFSTPTSNGYGINKDFKEGSQAYYSVKCPCCHTHQVLDFMRDVIIPGFDEPMNKFSKDALILPGIKIDEAYVQCPDCHGPISADAFKDAKNRGWVHTYPDREKHSFQVYPWDVYTYNPLHYVLAQVSEYKRTSDFWNNVAGLPFDDATNSFLASATEASEAVPFIVPEIGATGCFSGLDMGKLCWYVVMRPNPLSGTDDVIYAERIRETGESAVLKRALHLNKCFGVIRGVIDSAPDYNTALSYAQGGFYEQNWKAVYTKNMQKGMMGNFKLIPEEQNTVNIWRTGSFDTVSKAVNKRQVRFFSGNPDELQIIREHLGAMRRVEHENDTGDMVAMWIAQEGKDDHYAHALNYAKTARDMMATDGYFGGSTAALPMMTRARMKA